MRVVADVLALAQPVIEDSLDGALFGCGGSIVKGVNVAQIVTCKCLGKALCDLKIRVVLETFGTYPFKHVIDCDRDLDSLERLLEITSHPQILSQLVLLFSGATVAGLDQLRSHPKERFCVNGVWEVRGVSDLIYADASAVLMALR